MLGSDAGGTSSASTAFMKGMHFFASAALAWAASSFCSKFSGYIGREGNLLAGREGLCAGPLRGKPRCLSSL